MTRDDIIRMAQECRLIGEYPLIDGLYTEAIYQFAALVAAHEREACAKVVEESSLPDVYSEPALLDIAEAIRARGQK